MALSQTEKLKRIHADALQEFDEVQSAVRDERKQCLEDRRFYSIAGAMWEGTLGEQFENKPKFEVNKIHLAVIRIINEYRNNRITVDFVSKDGSDDDTLADACDSLYRADEQDSTANEAYDNAFEEAVGGGFGAFRLRAAYEDEEDDEDERQRIRIEPIYDADTCVFFDLQAKRQDKSDATKCWVLTSMTRTERSSCRVTHALLASLTAKATTPGNGVPAPLQPALPRPAHSWLGAGNSSAALPWRRWPLPIRLCWPS